MSTTPDTSAFVNAIACDLEEGGFRQVSGTTLRRTLTTAVSAALPLLADTGIPASQPAELAEQQGVDVDSPWPELDRTLVDAYNAGTEGDEFDILAARKTLTAAIAATGKQQVGEVQGDGLQTELLEHAANLERMAADDRETGESIEQAVESGEGYTPDDAVDVAAGLQHGANSAEETSALLRKAAAALAARQPGSVPPTAWLIEWKYGVTALTKDASEAEAHGEYKNCTEVPVYAAPPSHPVCSNCAGAGVIPYTSGQTPEQFEQGEYPCPECTPAQGIDLGQFREPVMSAHWEASNRRDDARQTGMTAAAERHAARVIEYDRLLALIDQRDAAPGVAS